MTEWFDLNPDEERVVTAFMSRVASLRVPNPGCSGALEQGKTDSEMGR